MACALVMLSSTRQVDNTHSTTVRTVYAWACPTPYGSPARLLASYTTSHSDRR